MSMATSILQLKILRRPTKSTQRFTQKTPILSQLCSDCSVVLILARETTLKPQNSTRRPLRLNKIELQLLSLILLKLKMTWLRLTSEWTIMMMPSMLLKKHYLRLDRRMRLLLPIWTTLLVEPSERRVIIKKLTNITKLLLNCSLNSWAKSTDRSEELAILWVLFIFISKITERPSISSILHSKSTKLD